MIIEGSLEDINKILSKYNPGYVVENVRIVKNNLGHPFKFTSNSELLPEYFKFVAGPETKMPDFVTILSGCINFEMKYKFGVIHYCTSRDNNMIWFEIYGNSKVSIDFLQRYIKATFESKDVIRCVLMAQTGEFFKVDKPPVLETSEAKPPVLQENDQPLTKRFKMEKCWKIKVQVNWEVYTVISRISAFEEAKPFNLCTYYESDYNELIRCTNGVVFKLSPKPGNEISDDDLIKLDARMIKEGLIVEEV